MYTILQRLERHGMVESDGADDGPQKGYRITADGEAELAAWLRNPPDLSSPPRDELVIRILIALGVGGWLLAGREQPAMGRQPLE